MRSESWSSWAAGTVFGSLAGMAIAVFGAPALALSLALLTLAFIASRTVALLSGALIGIGGTWLVLLVRAQLACAAFDAAPNQGCEAPDLGPFYVISGIAFCVGLLIGAVAWHRRPTQRPRSELR